MNSVVLSLLSIVINIMTQKNSGKEGLFQRAAVVHTEETEGGKPRQEPGDRNCSRGQGGILLLGLFRLLSDTIPGPPSHG